MCFCVLQSLLFCSLLLVELICRVNLHYGSFRACCFNYFLLLSGWLTGTSCHHAGLPTSLRLSLVTPCQLQIRSKYFCVLLGFSFGVHHGPNCNCDAYSLIHISLFLKLKWMPHVHFPWQGIIYLLNFFFFLFLYIK